MVYKLFKNYGNAHNLFRYSWFGPSEIPSGRTDGQYRVLVGHKETFAREEIMIKKYPWLDH